MCPLCSKLTAVLDLHPAHRYVHEQDTPHSVWLLPEELLPLQESRPKAKRASISKSEYFISFRITTPATWKTAPFRFTFADATRFARQVSCDRGLHAGSVVRGFSEVRALRVDHGTAVRSAT